MLEGKVIIVTGGSSGIGRAAASVLAKRGARLVVASRSADAQADVLSLANEHHAECIHVAADVTREDDVERLVAAALERFGRIDGAFNNASPGGGVFSTLADFTPQEFDDAVAGNLRSVWLCLRAEIKAMTARGIKGSIVCTSSVNGLGAAPLGSVYSAAKAGVLALCKGAALDYAAQGIRVNALVPGVFRTPMLEDVFRRASGGSVEGINAVEAAYVSRVPLGRIGRPEEAAEAVAWLLSDSSSYVTGASLIVDGGMTCFAR